MAFIPISVASHLCTGADVESLPTTDLFADTDSYKSRSADSAIGYLQDEIACANEAAGTAIELLGGPPSEPFVLSFGATPTAQVADHFRSIELNGVLEL